MASFLEVEVDQKIGSESFLTRNAKAIWFHMREPANEDLALNIKMVCYLGKWFQNQYFCFKSDRPHKGAMWCFGYWLTVFCHELASDESFHSLSLDMSAFVNGEIRGLFQGLHTKCPLLVRIDCHNISIGTGGQYPLRARTQMEKEIYGAVVDEISVDSVKAVKVPIPPKPIQDRLLELVKKARKRRAKLRIQGDEIVEKAEKEFVRLLVYPKLEPKK